MRDIKMTPSSDDIFLWADGTWCYRSDYLEYLWMSDDFLVLNVDTPEYHEFVDNDYTVTIPRKECCHKTVLLGHRCRGCPHEIDQDKLSKIAAWSNNVISLKK